LGGEAGGAARGSLVNSRWVGSGYTAGGTAGGSVELSVTVDIVYGVGTGLFNVTQERKERKVFRIGTVRHNWPMSAHASQAFSIAHCTDSEDLPTRTTVRIFPHRSSFCARPLPTVRG